VDDEARIEGLRELLAETAHAHHEATGGPNSNWSGWYAEYLVGKIDEYVGSSPDVETISSWLTAADNRHQTEEPDTKYWPTVYARYIVEDYAAQS
jgi:hypothetical protein